MVIAELTKSAPAQSVRARHRVVSIGGVSKTYRIYPSPQQRLRDALGLKAQFKEFNALDDVSFDVNAGEFWGIVGRNGSGKSTLLKIVAGLLRPTKGSVICDGRISLLQLGLGFDPELTGLENVRQSRLLQQLKNDYEEVVRFVTDFSELGDFINFPVRTYSSGMYSRLAFATAIAGDPDVLIADEVLAVGDMSFAQKCLAKMRQLKEQGKTVVLVTHDVNAVKTFCDRGIWLNDGKVLSIGSAHAVASQFFNFMLYGVTPASLGESGVDEPTQDALASTDCKQPDEGSGESVNHRNDCEPPDAGSAAPVSDQDWVEPSLQRRTVTFGKVDLLRYRFADSATGSSLSVIRPGRSVDFEIAFRLRQPMQLHSFGLTLHDRHGLIAVHLNSGFFSELPVPSEPLTEFIARFRFRAPFLASGQYTVSLGCSDQDGEGRVIEKYDYDSTFTIEYDKSAAIDKQGGYLVIPAGHFECLPHV